MTQRTNEYAEALFALALETDSADAFAAALKDMTATLKEHPDYIEFLACYGIPAAERTEALEAVFSDRVPEYVLSFVQLLCEHGQIKSIFDCAAQFEALYLESRRVATVKVTSAVELSDDQKARLAEKVKQLCKRDVLPIYEIDPSIMGGVIVETDGKVIDGSVKRRLHEVKDVIDG
ncbi:MAG: ATP synthase F1 subunit delta [Clostridia bacterium]|nr:ATP synthase F1 subunit delta [Clostridia bacterium]